MSYHEDFIRALDVIFINEGGYSNHPNDSGGKTMMGITEATLMEAHRRNIITHNDITMLKKEEAILIYYSMYWKPSHTESFPWPLSLIYFDSCIHHGIGGAIKLLQKTINRVLDDIVVVVDGKLGPITNKYIGLCINNANNLHNFCKIFLDVRENYMHDIVRRRPKNKSFINGWINRINRLRQYV